MPQSDAVIYASELNTDFDTIINELNGSISSQNLASNSVTSDEIASGIDLNEFDDWNAGVEETSDNCGGTNATTTCSKFPDRNGGTPTGVATDGVQEILQLRRQIRRLAPSAPFLVRGREGNLAIDPRSYARYDGYAEAIGALDARGAARLYATLKPRIDEAYRELGEPSPSFDDVLQRAIVRLLRMPVLRGIISPRSPRWGTPSTMPGNGGRRSCTTSARSGSIPIMPT